MKKNNKGFTFLETLVSLTLLIALVTGAIYFLVENNKKNSSNNFASEVVKYINMIDEKFSISGFRSDHWPIKTAEGYDDFKDFMYTNLNSKDSECGKPNGWTPIIDRTNYEADEFNEKNIEEVKDIENRNKTSLLGCNAFKNYYHFDLIPKVRVTVDENNNLVDTVDFIFEFKDAQSLDKDFILIKRAVDEMKSSDTENVSGGHFYTFIDKNDIDRDIKAVECFNLGTNCAVKASFKRSGQNDYLRTDGLNSIENNIMTFRVYDNKTGEVKSDLVHGVVKICERWVKENNAWIKKDDQKCGVGIYSDSLVASLIDGNTQANKTVYLNKQCNIYKIETDFELNTIPVTFKDTYEAALVKDDKTMPCGYYDNNTVLSGNTDGEMFILSDITNVEEVYVSGVYKDDEGNLVKDSKITVAPTLDMIEEDFISKQNYDNNPPSLTEEEKELNPSKGLFKKPSRTSVEKISDPSISNPLENKIKTVKTKDLVVYEDLIATDEYSLSPEDSFTLGELEVLNKFTLQKISEISNNNSLSAIEKEQRIRDLSYSNIKGNAIVSKNLNSNKMVIGDDRLFSYDDTNKRFSFKNTIENNDIIDEKNSGTPIDVANKIKQITASEDIKTESLAEAKDELKADTFQFVPTDGISAGSSCIEEGVIGADNNYDLFICSNGKWNNLINESGISAFNSDTCPAGWRDFTEADGRFLVGSGYFDTIHAGVVRYKVGDKGGEAKHKLLVKEMPSHSHFSPTVEHICSACHYNLGLAKIASGNSYWTKSSSGKRETASTGGDQAHENRPQYTTVKFCIKGSDEKFDYIEQDTTNPQDNWVEYEVEYTDWYDNGAKFNCSYEKQVDDSDPMNPKTYDVLVCNQDQRRDIKQRELNTRNGAIRYTGVIEYESRVIITQEAWQPYDVYYTECEEASNPYECTAWSPSSDSVLYGSMFTQKRECKIDMQRYKIVRERNWVNGSIRNKDTTKEMCEPKIEEYNRNATGRRVDPFTQNISAGTTTVRDRGRTIEYVGSFNLNHSSYSASAGNYITNELGHTIMIAAESDGNSCDNAIYAVNGNRTTNSFFATTDGARDWLEKYTTITFYRNSGTVYAKYNLTNQYTNGNYSSKRFGSGCSFQSNWYNSPNAIGYFTLDDE